MTTRRSHVPSRRILACAAVALSLAATLSACSAGSTATPAAAPSAAASTPVGTPAAKATTNTADSASGSGSESGTGQPTWCQPAQEAVETLLGKGTVFSITGDAKRCRIAATGGKRGVIDITNLTAFDPTATYAASRKGERAITCMGKIQEPTAAAPVSFLNTTCFDPTFTVNFYMEKAGQVYEIIYDGDASIPLTADQAGAAVVQMARLIPARS
jgi:hypothetical protein